MSDVTILAEGLGKKYIIGRQKVGERYTALRDVLIRGAHRLVRSATDLLRGRQLVAGEHIEEFWALEDVSFEVKRGEVLGIIGGNGAGKSTLLKILSRITEPSAGRVTIKGRVASLLEVGTGFHPELTGRENIYLNGAILGLCRAEIRAKFDEIVAFAEVEKFLDTPVKRYSSGMYVRLAFAVAAHLEPEILVVDEVLAVGDAEFQRKCLGKMQDVSASGRTICFVSHNMAAIAALCSRALLLERGRLIANTSVSECVDFYFGKTCNNTVFTPSGPRDDLTPHIKTIVLRSNKYRFGDTAEFDVTISSPTNSTLGIELELHDQRGQAIAYISTAPMLANPFRLTAGSETTFSFNMGPLPLATGRYYIYFWLIHPWITNHHVVDKPISFDIVDSDPGGTGFEFRQSYGRGACTLPISWNVRSPRETHQSSHNCLG